MSLLTPDLGLLFWMVIIFTAVFVVLARYGFPVILGMVRERNEFITNSMRSATEANLRLENIRKEADDIISEARRTQSKIVLEATDTAHEVINQAKQQAIIEGQKLIEQARVQIETERDNALKDIRSSVVSLSVEIAQRVLHSTMEDQHEQNELISRVMDQMESNN